MTDEPSPAILHAVALDTVGGVERLFTAYLGRSDDCRLEHHALIMRGKCHREFGEEVRRHSRSVRWAKYWGGFVKIPRWPCFLRADHLRRAIMDLSPDVAVLYNSLGSGRLWEAVRTADTRHLYYDRGAAWGPADPEMNTCIADATSLLCCSHASRRMLELRWGVPEGRAEVLHNPSVLHLSGDDHLSSAPPSDRPVRLGAVGRLVPIKGFPVALHTAALLRDRGVDCQLEVAGVGARMEALRRLTDRLGLGDVVRFHGLVTDMPAFYRGIDIFLCPSLREPFGNVCVEAAACGRPVVATAVDGLVESVSDGETGFCVEPSLTQQDYRKMGGDTEGLPEWVYNPTEDGPSRPTPAAPEEFADRVQLLCGDPDLFRSMSAAAHRRATEKFALTDYVEKFDSLLVQLA